MRSLKACALALSMCGFIALQLSGCGGGGSLGDGGGGGGKTDPTVSSVTPTSTKTAMTVGDTAQGSCSVKMSDGSTNSNCTLSSDASSVFTVDSTGKITAVGDGVANLVATATAAPSVTGKLSITVSSTVTSVAVAASPATITTTQTSTITVTAAGAGDFNPAVSLTASSGTIGNVVLSGNVTTATFTPSGAGTATVTATSRQDSTKSGSATVTVTSAAPVITSVTLNGTTDNWMFCPISCYKTTASFAITGSGFQAGDTLNFDGYWPSETLTSSEVNGNTVVVGGLQFGANQQPNFIYFQICSSDGTSCSNTKAFGYVGGYNSAEHGPNGELINQFHGTAYVWQAGSGGAFSNTLQLSLGAASGLNTVYETDGSTALFVNGPQPYDLKGVSQNGASWDGGATATTAADDGYVMYFEPEQDEVVLYKPTSTGNPTSVTFTLGKMPYAGAMYTANGVTHGIIASVDGSPTLWTVDMSGNLLGSAPLTGVTSWSNIVAANNLQGHWSMVLIPGKAEVAFVSTYDQLMLIYDVSGNSPKLLNPTKPISLSSCAVPLDVDAYASASAEMLSVDCLKLAGFGDSGTTFLSVDPATGTVTADSSTSAAYPGGFRADANSLYVFQGTAAPDVQPNR